MKKHVFIVFAMFIILAACSSATTENIGKPDDTTEETRVFETVNGEIEIPNKPKRIVTDFYGGELLTVGANVVGVEPTAFDHPFIQDKLKDVEDIGEPINIEKVLSLQPDLIVVMYDYYYEQLSEIAPTVYIPYGTTTNIEETVQLFADLTGNIEEGKAFLSKFEAKAEEGREKIKDVINENDTFGIYELTDKGDIWIFGDNAGRGGQALYNALQLKMPYKNDNKEQTLQLSMEVLPEYAADYMFLTTYDPENKGEALQDLKASSIWQGLDAMKNERIFYNDFDTFYRYDPIAVYEQIDLFVEMILESNQVTE
ncbi:MAG TPA: ABC transporter substrate-binding protein [Candidatus Pseudogracilibacillus intestinigallinarum]|uniref:ABC transporter substrate-binding protein n=1 Tax=Candidatus Pseudogracilibacillus intestinigallinarum TaxID=2838742 RepID=A0A9D1PM72_9BACI|nr:ABC transporter substrate-binding protein [Candidatus Pseudogracilibacillus intestinigallinarum]